MHVFSRTDNCIHRTRLNAKGAANAQGFINDGNDPWFGCSVPDVQWFGLDAQ